MSNSVVGFNFDDICGKKFNELHEIWISTYGRDSKETKQSIATVKQLLENFWQDQIEIEERHKATLMNNIECMGIEALELEKILKLPQQVMELNNDTPLLQLKTSLENLIESYRELGNQRTKEYEEMRKQEEKLCALLGESITILPLPASDASTGLKTSRTVSRSQLCVPSDEKLEECRARVEGLMMLEVDMREKFLHLKEELGILLKECEVLPLTKYERFAVATDEDGLALVPFSGASLAEMKELVRIESEKKKELIVEADELRHEISKVSKKLMKDPMFLESLFADYSGFGRQTIQKLQKVLSELAAERKYKLKELILLHRDMLEELWSKCSYSDQERSQFKAYYADHFSEDILTLHELEVERLELFYDQHKRIFVLAEKHRELWDRLLHLEQEASSSQRLFTNRGGRLLMEEKERKTIQKKLPAVKAELVTLLNQYKAEHGVDFLYLGAKLIDTLEQLEEEREAAKENVKKQRKAANSETLRLESRLGTQPVAVKRKMVPPKSNSNKTMKMSAHSTATHSTTSSSKSASSYNGQKPLPTHNTLLTPGRVGIRSAACYVMRHTPQMHTTEVPSTTPARSKAPQKSAASTPENNSPSYESFQEMLLDPTLNRICHNSTKTDERVLRPRNEAQSKTPFKTPSRTPRKIPSKTPFRIATGSKIPSVVPPISPRRGVQLLTPRSRLPIIF